MATWDELARYVNGTYTISEQDDTSMLLEFSTGNDRTQLVMLKRVTLDEGAEEWVLIESPIGSIEEVNLRAAAQHVGAMVCGGLAAMGNDLVGLRHAVPLENLDLNEFERPLGLVTMSADALENLLVGKDSL